LLKQSACEVCCNFDSMQYVERTYVPSCSAANKDKFLVQIRF